MKIQHALEIDAPLDRVWALTVGVEDWPILTPTVTSVKRLDDGALRVGSRVRLKQPGQPARVWTVTALEPQRRFAWSTELLGTTMTGVHELAATGNGTKNTLRVELTGWSSSLLGILLRAPIAKAIAKENEGFKTAAESPRDRGSGSS